MNGHSPGEQPDDRFLTADRRISVSTSCYAPEVIFRTCYAFTDRAYLWLEPGNEDSIVVSITRKSMEPDLEALAGDADDQSSEGKHAHVHRPTSHAAGWTGP
jgi:hypothetical protein